MNHDPDHGFKDYDTWLRPQDQPDDDTEHRWYLDLSLLVPSLVFLCGPCARRTADYMKEWTPFRIQRPKCALCGEPTYPPNPDPDDYREDDR